MKKCLLIFTLIALVLPLFMTIGCGTKFTFNSDEGPFQIEGKDGGQPSAEMVIGLLHTS